MATALTRTRRAQTMRSTPPAGGGTVARGTLGWYEDASGGFLLETLDEWNPRLAFLVFPRITSSSRIDRRDIGRFAPDIQPVVTLPVARQAWELQAALSINKSELARILRVSRPTVYEWLDDGEPNAGNRADPDADAAALAVLRGLGEQPPLTALREVCA